MVILVKKPPRELEAGEKRCGVYNVSEEFVLRSAAT